MSIGKKLENFAKSIIHAPRIFARYGTLRPSRVQLVGCTHWVHIDPTDRRAVKKFIQDPIRGRISPPRAFWGAFNQHLKPAVAVDVGVNYGECLFGICYAARTRIFGFEANPRLSPLLEKSRVAHPDGARMTITNGIVSDQTSDQVPFYVNPTWSGGASAISSLNSGGGILSFHITARTLDSIIPLELVRDQCLLFKMDIEGYESRAFGGFQQTLKAASLAVGFIEFDSTYITAAGESPEAYFQRLAQLFDVFRLIDSRKQLLTPVGDYSALPYSRATDSRIHTDLILVTPNVSPSTWLPQGWELR